MAEVAFGRETCVCGGCDLPLIAGQRDDQVLGVQPTREARVRRHIEPRQGQRRWVSIAEREIFIDNLLVRVHLIIETSRPALRHGNLNSLFQAALCLPSFATHSQLWWRRGGMGLVADRSALTQRWGRDFLRSSWGTSEAWRPPNVWLATWGATRLHLAPRNLLRVRRAPKGTARRLLGLQSVRLALRGASRPRCSPRALPARRDATRSPRMLRSVLLAPRGPTRLQLGLRTLPCARRALQGPTRSLRGLRSVRFALRGATRLQLGLRTTPRACHVLRGPIRLNLGLRALPHARRALQGATRSCLGLRRVRFAPRGATRLKPGLRTLPLARRALQGPTRLQLGLRTLPHARRALQGPTR